MLDDNVENDLTNGSRNFARWSVKVNYSGKSSDLRETPKPKFVFEFDCEFVIQKFELSNLTHCPISLVSSTLELFGGWLISRDDWPNSHENWKKVTLSDHKVDRVDQLKSQIRSKLQKTQSM